MPQSLYHMATSIPVAFALVFTGCCPRNVLVVRENVEGHIPWEDAVAVIEQADVTSVFQNHQRHVWIKLEDGRTLRTVEPQIDDIIRVIEKAGRRGELQVGTE